MKMFWGTTHSKHVQHISQEHGPEGRHRDGKRCKILSEAWAYTYARAHTHTRIQKVIPSSGPSLALIRQLWGVHVAESRCYEPTQLCVDFTLVLVTTVHGWLVRSAVYAVWLVECKATTHAVGVAALVLFCAASMAEAGAWHIAWGCAGSHAQLRQGHTRCV